MSDQIVESVKTAIEEIDKRGLKGDVYALKEKAIGHSIKKGELSESSGYDDIGLGIRVIKDDKIGFGYCVPGKEEKGVKHAIELSDFSERLDLELPSEKDTPGVEVYDEKVRDVIEDSEGAELTQKMIDGSSSVADDITPTRGGLNVSMGTRVIGNTEGLFLKEKGSSIFGSVTVSIPQEETSLQATEIGVDCKLDLDFEEIGGKAANKVDSIRSSSERLSGDHPVVISPYAITQLIGFGLIPAINGENVRKGKSVYQGKIGEKVASEDLLMKDDPTVDWGVGSGAFDDEGVISKDTPIISDGILKNFIYDLKESAKDEKESTGNGVRSGFKSLPETTHRNIVLEGEGKDRDDLMPDKGIYVDNVLGAHTANPVSGDFSVVTNPVWRVEDGERKGRIDGLMISGNLPEILKSIELADDRKKCFLQIGSRRLIIETPTVRLNDVTISGK
ncbi:MAG: TldD/PmbA family protein [Candidatus Thermoplasmatota archaeon]|nr:TldD/PmbA family protein [Candidatus Thermoplasmatota archaeon]